MPRPKISDILDLSIPERIELVQEIWDSISEVPEEISLTDSQRKALDARSEKMRQNSNSGYLWTEIKANLRL